MNESQVGQCNPSTWQTVWKLLRLRIMIFVNGIMRAKTRQKISLSIFGLVLVGFMGFVIYLSWLLLQGLQSPALVESIGDMTNLVISIPSLIFSGAFIGILVTSFGLLLQALYLSGDIEFLLAAPIPMRAVFMTKLLQAILPNFALISAVALPVLIGLGVSQNFSILYYPLVIILLIALALAAAGISSLLVMLAARIFPARRMVEILGFIGGITSLICSQSGQLARFEEFSPDQTEQVFQVISRFNLPWSPLTWAGNGLVQIGQGTWISGGFQVTLMLGISIAIFGISLVTAERLYYSGWARIQGQKRKKKTTQSEKMIRNNIFAPIAETLIPSGLRAILVKDFLMMRRDLRNLSQLVTPLIFGIIYAFIFLGDTREISAEPGEISEFFLPVIENISMYSTVGIAMLVGWMLILRLGSMGFSQEGKNYWLLKSAPLSTRTLIIAKFMVAYLPVLALSWAFVILLSVLQGSNLSQLWFTLPVVALSFAGGIGLSLTFGITGANMNWDDPRQMQKTGSGCLSSIVSMLYLPLSLLLFFVPMLVMQFFGQPNWAGQVLGILVGAAFSLACAIIPLWLVRHAVKRLGES